MKSLNRLLGTSTAEINDSMIIGTKILTHSNSLMSTLKKKLQVSSHTLQGKGTTVDTMMIQIRIKRTIHTTGVGVALDRGTRTRWSLKIWITT